MKIIRREGHRIYAEFNEEEQARWEEAVAAEERAKPANVARAKERFAQMRAAALAEDNFRGQLRRWIDGCGMPDTEVAEKSGIALGQIRNFMGGRRVLSTEELDHLLPVPKIVSHQEQSS